MLVFQKEKRAGNLANSNDFSGKTNKPLLTVFEQEVFNLAPPPSSTKMMLFCAWLHPLRSYTYLCVFFHFYLSHLLLLNETKSAFLLAALLHSACLGFSVWINRIYGLMVLSTMCIAQFLFIYNSQEKKLQWVFSQI
jgi:hypothetical protein